MTENFQSLENSGAQTSNHWKKSSVVLSIIVIALSVLPYLFSIRFDFVYDDHGSIVENPFLHQPGAWAKALTFQTFFEPRILDGQRPVVILSYLIDKAMYGFSPAGFHATNILLHAAAVALLFALMGALGATLRLRFAATLLFGLHPVLTEAVHVPAFREDLLAGVFTLAFLLLAVRRKFITALIALFLALCSKETAIVAPALLAWLWLCFPSSSTSNSSSEICNLKSEISDHPPPPTSARNQIPKLKFQILFLAASIALVAIYLLITFTHRPLQSAGEIWNGLALRWPDNVSTSPWIFARELWTLLIPFPLCADYIVKPAAFTGPKFIAGIIAMLCVAAAALALRRRAPFCAFGLGWLLINFVPISNIIPLFNPMADRYLYFPAIGFCLAIAALIEGQLRDVGRGTAESISGQSAPFAVGTFHFTRLRTVLLFIITAAYFVLTTARLQNWRNDETLWNVTVKTEPRSARAQTWLGLIASGKGDSAEARKRYEIAEILNPNNVHALINLAIMDGKSGNLAGAERRLRMAVQRRPDFADGWWNLATALHLLGRDAEADEAARRAAQIDPYDPRAAPLASTPQT